jgi:hypothetical protein
MIMVNFIKYQWEKKTDAMVKLYGMSFEGIYRRRILEGPRMSEILLKMVPAKCFSIPYFFSMKQGFIDGEF